MVECSKVNVTLSDLHLNKIKSAVKNQTGVALRMSMTMFNGKNLPHELLLTTRQKIKLRNKFKNNMSTDIKLPKTQISKIIQSFVLGSLLSKKSGPLTKLAVPLAKNTLTPLGITAAASAIDSGIQKQIHGNNENCSSS